MALNKKNCPFVIVIILLEGVHCTWNTSLFLYKINKFVVQSSGTES